MSSTQYGPTDPAPIETDRGVARRNDRRLSRWFGPSLAFALLLSEGCGKQPAPEKAPAKAPEWVPVTVASVEEAPWDKAIPIVGTLFAKDEATVAAEVDGLVEKTTVDFGDRIKAGDVIAYIDTKSYEAYAEQAAGNLAKAEANSANAEQTLKRTQALSTNGIASASDLEQAVAQARQWQAEVKAARGAATIAKLNVDRSTVRAPFDAAVSQRIASKGDYLKVGAPLYQIVNDSVLKFIVQVPERNAGEIAKGQLMTFSVDAFPGETFSGKVYLISPSVNLASRAFGVGALVQNPDHKLKANTYARGQLVVQQGAPTKTVPTEAVQNFAGVTKVFVVEADTAKSRLVSVGRIKDGRQEILRGLERGETVVVSGQTKLREDGTKVKPKEATHETPKRAS